MPSNGLEFLVTDPELVPAFLRKEVPNIMYQFFQCFPDLPQKGRGVCATAWHPGKQGIVLFIHSFMHDRTWVADLDGKDEDGRPKYSFRDPTDDERTVLTLTIQTAADMEKNYGDAMLGKVVTHGQDGKITGIDKDQSLPHNTKKGYLN